MKDVASILFIGNWLLYQTFALLTAQTSQYLSRAVPLLRFGHSPERVDGDFAVLNVASLGSVLCFGSVF